ncbi:unnamed protein product [Penicillium glandicola]
MPGHTEHPEPTPTPAPTYSEAPEAVFPTHPAQGPVSPPHSVTYSHTGQSLPDTMHSSYAPTPINGPGEKQYPFQPDSIGQAPEYDTSMPPPEKAYPGQPVPQYQNTQGLPQQFYTPVGHPSGYVTAVPLHSVQSAPCPVDCPVCGERELTRVEAVSGGTTHGWAAILCFCCCLGCIPYLMASLKDVEHSCDKMIRLIFTATAIITSSSAIYFYIFHERLSKRIAHKAHIGTLSTAIKTPNIESIPETVFSDEYFTLYDYASQSVSRACLPSSESTDLLFKRLVRRNMRAFSRFPQALVLAMASKTPEQKKSFKAGYLGALDFEVGDLVCGVYRVVLRRRDRIEFEIKMETVDFVQGRLAISYEESSSRAEGKVVFCSETVMWKRAEEVRKMPLERPVLRWMHETAAWWLMDSGIKYLVDLEG